MVPGLGSTTGVNENHRNNCTEGGGITSNDRKVKPQCEDKLWTQDLQTQPARTKNVEIGCTGGGGITSGERQGSP